MTGKLQVRTKKQANHLTQSPYKNFILSAN